MLWEGEIYSPQRDDIDAYESCKETILVMPGKGAKPLSMESQERSNETQKEIPEDMKQEVTWVLEGNWWIHQMKESFRGTLHLPVMVDAFGLCMPTLVWHRHLSRWTPHKICQEVGGGNIGSSGRQVCLQTQDATRISKKAVSNPPGL